MNISKKFLHRWAGNVKRLLFGPGEWTAEKEFSLYEVNEQVIRLHRDRQMELRNQCYLPGLRILRALDIGADQLEGRRVLEIGAGESYVSQALAIGGPLEVWAVDAVPKQIWAAAERNATSRTLKFLVAAATDLPFEGDQFDLVTANLVLHHIRPLESVLREVSRVLKPGGSFVAFEPNPLLGALAHEASENEAPVPPGAILRALAAAEFTKMSHEYWWTRFETSSFGWLSPGYRVRAQKAGTRAPVTGSVLLRRRLGPMKLPGLFLDSGCAFAKLVRQQESQILTHLAPR